ncbi:hypothetical protein RBH29_16725 [Herbivorax sp. ANBcel31]|uniref:ABC-three component system protein n=1 Tax=Herbivorax sp. ANBcel31 TaxID=3069754 RepID=UPI0027B23C0A|nr:ABC-three component system protein [Herbivorax sp. ANBcel31]MDQ2088074.1 hypothetical protein [Herbivorax sp. ANBcel31]
MNVNEKTLVRQLFQNKIFKSDGQLFEDMFVDIMNYAEKEFQAIKPWGNIGDRKNDGYIRDKGIYFQVYAPEDIRKSYIDVIAKLNKDFSKLKEYWDPINKFYFVVNDKYKGVNAECEQAIRMLKNKYQLSETKFFTAKDIENILFTLEDDQIFSIVGHIPDPSKIKQIDYSILSEVISHIMKLPLKGNGDDDIVLPDWEEKIIFNKLTEPVAYLLKGGYLQVFCLEEYLANNSNFLADALREKINDVYSEEKELNSGDKLFWNIVERLSPRLEHAYQTTVIVIMAKYFETCDIFEEPSLEGEK